MPRRAPPPEPEHIGPDDARGNRTHYIWDGAGYLHHFSGRTEVGFPDTSYGPWVNTTPPGITESEMEVQMQQLYKDTERAWKESPHFTRLVVCFEREIAPVVKPEITSCICAGLGPLTPRIKWGKQYEANSPMYQLVAFETMVDILKKTHKIETVYFQDPAFVALDKKFLQSLHKGYKIVEDPQAINDMTKKTFLFAPFLDNKTTHLFLTVDFPALYVGGDLKDYRDSVLKFHSRSDLEDDEKKVYETFMAFIKGKEEKYMYIYDVHPLPKDLSNAIMVPFTMHWQAD